MLALPRPPFCGAFAFSTVYNTNRKRSKQANNSLSDALAVFAQSIRASEEAERAGRGDQANMLKCPGMLEAIGADTAAIECVRTQFLNGLKLSRVN